MKTVEPMSVEGRIQIPYRWPAGKLGTQFLMALRDEGQILGARCLECDRVDVPPQPVCRSCGRQVQDRVLLAPKGDLWAWTVRGETMYALIQLDGADSFMVHRLLARPPSHGPTRPRVEAVFADSKTGAITDIVGFRPV